MTHLPVRVLPDEAEGLLRFSHKLRKITVVLYKSSDFAHAFRRTSIIDRGVDPSCPLTGQYFGRASTDLRFVEDFSHRKKRM